MNIYIAGSISGQSAEEVISYFSATKQELGLCGYNVFSPMTAKGSFRNEIKFKAFKPDGYAGPPVSSNHAIIERDRWMVSMADVLYCNLTMAKIVSIGSMMELAWAHHMGKHTVISMQPDNIHRHAFVLEAGDIIFETHNEAMEYLQILQRGKL